MQEVGKTKGRGHGINVKFNFSKCFPTQLAGGCSWRLLTQLIIKTWRYFHHHHPLPHHITHSAGPEHPGRSLSFSLKGMAGMTKEKIKKNT